MEEEKIIKPANGFIMLLVVLVLFFGGITMSIIQQTPLYIPVIIIGFFVFLVLSLSIQILLKLFYCSVNM